MNIMSISAFILTTTFIFVISHTLVNWAALSPCHLTSYFWTAPLVTIWIISFMNGLFLVLESCKFLLIFETLIPNYVVLGPRLRDIRFFVEILICLSMNILKQAGDELGQAQYKIGLLGKLMSSASCLASIKVNFNKDTIP